MNIFTTMMAYGGIAVCLVSILCGILGLIRVFIAKENHSIASLFFFIPAIVFSVIMFIIYGWNIMELRESFFFEIELQRPASLEMVMTVIVFIQLAVLVLAVILLLRKRVNKANMVLLSLSTTLILALLVLDFMYFYFIYPVSSIISGSCNLILLFVLCTLHKGLLNPNLKKWLPLLFLVLALCYAVITADFARIFDHMPPFDKFLVISPFVIPIYLTIMYYIKEWRLQKKAVPTAQP